MVAAADLLFGKNNEKPMFDDRKQIKSWIQNRLLPLGILIVIERSDDTKIVFKCKSYRYSSAFKKVRQKRISKKQKQLLQKQGLLDSFELEQKLKQKKIKTSSCSCPFRIRANFSIRSNKWSIVIVNGQHNHPLKNCLDNNGEFFNDESFNHDIHVNLIKNRFHSNPAEPEMVEEYEEDSLKKTNAPGNMADNVSSSSSSSPSAAPSEDSLSRVPSNQYASIASAPVNVSNGIKSSIFSQLQTTPNSPLVVNSNPLSKFNHNDQFSLSSNISSISSENSMDDFFGAASNLSHQMGNVNAVSSVTDSSSNNDNGISNDNNYHFGELSLAHGKDHNTASSYNSPFFEPVHDEEEDLNTGMTNMDDLIADFFNKKRSTIDSNANQQHSQNNINNNMASSGCQNSPLPNPRSLSSGNIPSYQHNQHLAQIKNYPLFSHLMETFQNDMMSNNSSLMNSPISHHAVPQPQAHDGRDLPYSNHVNYGSSANMRQTGNNNSSNGIVVADAHHSDSSSETLNHFNIENNRGFYDNNNASPVVMEQVGDHYNSNDAVYGNGNNNGADDNANAEDLSNIPITTFINDCPALY